MSNFDRKPTSTSSSTSVDTAESASSGFSLDGFLGGLAGLTGGGATTAVAPTPPRIVKGKDRLYVYKQDADGTITIIAGPARVGERHAPGTPVCDAITAQIGPYRSPIPATPASPAAGGNPMSGIIETISGLDPFGFMRDLIGGGSGGGGGGGGGESEAPAKMPPAEQAPAPTTNPAFHDKTPTIEGSTLAVAGTRLDMETNYNLRQGRNAARDGDKNATTFFCSSFSEWTLAASGYDMKEPLRGEDGVPFSYTDGNAPNKPGTQVTLGMLINGQTEAVTTMSEVKRQGRTNGGWVLHIDENNLHDGFKSGVDAGEDAVKGAAGAFELAGIGKEVPQAEQRPGDFAQARWTSSAKAAHTGDGHAWQVWSVRVLGAAMFGKPGSPKPVSGQLDGWHVNVEFVIDDATDPGLVGPIVRTTAAERIEANTPGTSSQDKDKDKDGGVGLTGFVGVPDPNPKGYKNYVVFYGRLSSSKWTTWKPATPPKEGT